MTTKAPVTTTDPLDPARLKIARARNRLAFDAPFYGSMTFYVGVLERTTPDNPTMATDMVNIYWNRDFVMKLSDDEVRGVLAHEVLHIVLKHGLRRGDRDPEKWNIAADYAINQILLDEGFVLPKDRLHDPVFKGMAAEKIYTLLPEKNKSGGGGYGKHKPQGWGDFTDPVDGNGKPISGADLKGLAEDIDANTRQSANHARLQGKLPGGLSELITTATAPQVDWRDRIRATIGRGKPDDYSWSKLNRAVIGAYGIAAPSMIKKGCGTVVVVIDTSGSISDRDVKAYLGEINAIISECSPETAVLIQCDAEIQHTEVRTDGEPLAGIKIHGRGGTCFKPPFKWVEKNVEGEVDSLVYLTDGYGDFPSGPPPYPTIWVMTTDVVAPFGETVKISQADQ